MRRPTQTGRDLSQCYISFNIKISSASDEPGASSAFPRNCAYSYQGRFQQVAEHKMAPNENNEPEDKNDGA